MKRTDERREEESTVLFYCLTYYVLLSLDAARPHPASTSGLVVLSSERSWRLSDGHSQASRLESRTFFLQG